MLGMFFPNISPIFEGEIFKLCHVTYTLHWWMNFQKPFMYWLHIKKYYSIISYYIYVCSVAITCNFKDLMLLYICESDCTPKDYNYMCLEMQFHL